ncbi:MAG: hypothetical protein N2595_01545 [bacterium]|nr:hypothetical protein [bacterium]
MSELRREEILEWSKFLALLVAVGVAGALFVRLAFYSEGWDWPLSEFQARVAYSAVRHYYELPLFSYLVNGGEYLVQNPQGMTTSPTLLWVVACGPRAGLRWAVGMYACLGVLGMWLWLRRYVGHGAGLCAGVSWMLSLGFFWRVAVGNDMFMWQGLLPLVLWAIDEIWERPGWGSAALCAALGSVIAYGPVFHAVLYVLGPGAVVWWGVRLVAEVWRRGGMRRCVRAHAWSSLAVVAIAIISWPRLMMWVQMPMGREIRFDGTPRWEVALRSLVDARYVAVTWLPRVGSWPWGVWETAVAPAWITTVCGVVGLIVGLRRFAQLWCYAVILLGLGFLLAAHVALYRWLFDLCEGRFRVPDRFLMLGACGLVVLAACGVRRVEMWLPRWMRPLLIGCVTVGVIAQAWWWQVAAQRAGTLKAAMLAYRDEPACEARAGMATCALPSEDGRVIFSGNMALRKMPQPGNDWNVTFARELLGAAAHTCAVFKLTGTTEVALTHRRVIVRNLGPNAEVYAQVLPGFFGESVQVEPPEARVKVLRGRMHLRISNSGTVPVRELIIAARVPTWLDPRRADDTSPQVHLEHDGGLLRNGGFDEDLSSWQFWNAARSVSNCLRIVPARTSMGMRYALRIENPQRLLVGVEQRVVLVSNTVYRLGGAARSVATTDSNVLFGGRIAVWLPPQPERELIWMSEYNDWWQKYLIFTNEVSGTAVVYVHLGYGNVATTGEFTNITLEELR